MLKMKIHTKQNKKKKTRERGKGIEEKERRESGKDKFEKRTGLYYRSGTDQKRGR